MTNFDKAFSLLTSPDVEGSRFVDDANDDGGPTKYGITLKTFLRHRPSGTLDDLKKLNILEASVIYKAEYWQSWMDLPDMPAHVSIFCFINIVHMWVPRSIKLAQQAVHLPDDGKVGPITIKAFKTVAADRFCIELGLNVLKHYRTLSDYKHFENGWTRRILATVSYCSAEAVS